jgi:hypothetical protein
VPTHEREHLGLGDVDVTVSRQLAAGYTHVLVGGWLHQRDQLAVGETTVFQRDRISPGDALGNTIGGLLMLMV